MSDAQLPLEPGPELIILYALGLVRSGHHVLDAGCFRGDDSIFLATGGCRVTGIDQSKGAIQYAKKVALMFGVARSARFIAGNIPEAFGRLPDNSFDVVCDRLLMSNLNQVDRSTYVKEVRRVLRPGGLFVLRYGISSPLPLHADRGKLPRGLIPRGFQLFQWIDATRKPQNRRTQPARMALYPTRFGFTAEAWFLVLTRK
jgi:ubiquinone/menaquinone biosynthesis C-methylase UbiE